MGNVATIREKAFALTAPDLAVSVESDSRQKYPQDQSCSVWHREAHETGPDH